MSLGRLLRRASSKASDLLTLTTGGSGGSLSVLDGEVIYSKNNVCVHAPEGLQGPGEHHPGEAGVRHTKPGKGSPRPEGLGGSPQGVTLFVFPGLQLLRNRGSTGRPERETSSISVLDLCVTCDRSWSLVVSGNGASPRLPVFWRLSLRLSEAQLGAIWDWWL